MLRSLAGPGRPVCASDAGAPDAKHKKIDARPSPRPASAARAASVAAKGALPSSAAASNKARPTRLAALGRRVGETVRVMS